MPRKPTAHGRLEVAIVAYLRREQARDARLYSGEFSYPTDKIIRFVYGLSWPSEPSAAQAVAVRRALRSLVAKGLAKQTYRGAKKHSAEWIPAGPPTKKERREAGRQKREERKRSQERLNEIFDQMFQRKGNDAERATLAKILGMLGSDHQGEREQAAVQAERLRKKLGITWQELLGIT